MYLAGTSLALSIERKVQRGIDPGRIDRDLLIRGLLILSVDLTIIAYFWVPGLLLFQVMYAIGGAMMALALAVLFRIQRHLGDRISRSNPILVFGQTAFFFYVAHIVVLEVAAHALGIHQQGGLGTSIVAFVFALMALYPICLWYRRVKARRPGSWLRFF